MSPSHDRWAFPRSFALCLSAAVVTTAAAAVPSVTLLSGDKMPMSGLGLCCRPSASGDAVRQSVLDYLLMGGRHLDTAEIYKNHYEVGLGIQQALAQGVPRSEIFLTSKVHASSFGFAKTLAWVPQMLGELGVDYVDLVLLHNAGRDDPECGTAQQCRLESWLAMQRFWRSGQIKNLGVSNMGGRQIRELQALKGAPVTVNQLEYHPWVPTEMRDAATYCHQHGIAVVAYGSMGSSGGAAQLTSEPALQEVGTMYRKSAGQALLRWAVQRNVTVIPGTGNPKHMAENMDVFDFTLSEPAMEFLDSLQQGQTFSLFNHYPDAIP